MMKMLDMETMVIAVVGCSHKEFGTLKFITKNTEGVFGEGGSTLKNLNISQHFSEYFKPIHTLVMNDFISKQDKDYFGMQRNRFVRIDNSGIIHESEVLVTINPVLYHGMNFLCLIKKVFSSDCYLRVIPDGTITGYNTNLLAIFPDIATFLGNNLSKISPDLNKLVASNIKKALSQRKPFKSNKSISEKSHKELLNDNSGNKAVRIELGNLNDNA